MFGEITVLHDILYPLQVGIERGIPLLLDDMPVFSLYQLSQVVCLLVLLRLAVLLNQKRRDDLLPEFTANAAMQTLELNLGRDWLTQQSLLAADLVAEQKALKKIAFVLDCPELAASSTVLS